MEILREAWQLLLATIAVLCLVPVVRSRKVWVKWIAGVLAAALTIASISAIALTGKGLEETLVCGAAPNAPGCRPADSTVSMRNWTFLETVGSQGTPLCGIVTARSDTASPESVAVKGFKDRPLIFSVAKPRWNWVTGTTVNLLVDFGLGNPPIQFPGVGSGHVVEVHIPEEHTADLLLDIAENRWIQISFPNIDEPTWFIEDPDAAPAVRQLTACIKRHLGK